MAHSTLHFSLGMVIGSAAAAPRLMRALAGREKLSDAFRFWFGASYAAGLFAAFPGVLRRFGVPDAVCDGWWMNVFILYPLLNELKPGGMTMGPLVMGALMGCQYIALVAALAWCLRRQKSAAGEDID